MIYDQLLEAYHKLLINIIAVLFLCGCNDGYSQQQLQCRDLCSELNYICNPTNIGEFEYGLCYDYCVELPTQQELDNFQSCSECYMAISCNDEIYTSICYPSCES